MNLRTNTMKIFALSFFSMDVQNISHVQTSEFFQKFAFTCIDSSRWDTEATGLAEILFTMHPVIILMSSTLCLIVLSSIAFHFDRLSKTKKEKKIEKEMKRLEIEARRNRRLSQIDRFSRTGSFVNLQNIFRSSSRAQNKGKRTYTGQLTNPKSAPL